MSVLIVNCTKKLVHMKCNPCQVRNLWTKSKFDGTRLRVTLVILTVKAKVKCLCVICRRNSLVMLVKIPFDVSRF